MAAGRVRDRVASVAIKLNDTSCPCGGVEANLFCHGFDSLGCHHGSVVSSRYVESLGMTVERMRLLHSIRVWRRSWAAAVSQTRIPAHWANSSAFPEPSEPTIPGRSCDRHVSRRDDN